MSSSSSTNAPFLLLTSLLLIWAFISIASPSLPFTSLSKLLSFIQGKQTTNFLETQEFDQKVVALGHFYEENDYLPLLPYERDVVELTSGDVSQFLMEEGNRYVMVQFYAPWCFWSKRLRPAYAAAATKLKGEAVLAKVDASEDVSLRNHYKVNGYPTMLFFVNGVYVDAYYGNRSSDDIVAWVRGNMGSQIYNVTTAEMGERILAAKSTIVLAFVDALKGTYTEELAIASKLHTDVNFYQTACAHVAKMFHIDPEIIRPALVVLKNGSGIHNHLDGQFNSRAIAGFVSSSKRSLENTFIFEKVSNFLQESMIAGQDARPLQTFDKKDIVKLTEGNLSQFLMAEGNRYVMVNFYAPCCHWSKRLRVPYAVAARKLEGDAVLAKVNAIEDSALAAEYNISAYPTMLFFINGAYVDSYFGERNSDAIANWVRGKMVSQIYSIATIQEAERILAAKSMIVMAFVGSLQATYTEELVAASKLHTDVNFYQTASADIAAMFHFDRPIQRPALVVLKKEYGIQNHLFGKFTRRAIAELVSWSKRPLLTTFTMEKASKFRQESAITGPEAHPVQTFDEKDVVKLTAGNLSRFLMAESNRYVMVQFYAPWCYWSKRLRAPYAAAATKLKGDAVLAKVDCVEDYALGAEYKIQGYPTLLFFINGAYVDSYYGERSRDAISTWVKGKMSSQIYNITTTQMADLILAAKSMIVVAFVDSLEAAHTDELAAASKLHVDVNFYQTDRADIAAMFHIDRQIQRPALVVLKKESGIHNHLIGEFTSAAIAKLVSLSKRPPLTIFNIEKDPERLSFREDFHEDKHSTQPVWT